MSLPGINTPDVNVIELFISILMLWTNKLEYFPLQVFTDKYNILSSVELIVMTDFVDCLTVLHSIGTLLALPEEILPE